MKKSITDAMDNLQKEIFVKLQSLKLCSGGFNTISYLKTRGNAEIDYYALSRNSPSLKRTATPKDIAHPDLYAQIKKWRNDLAAENNLPVYLILPQKVLTDLVTFLPANLAELGTIKGIGKQKVKQYGQEIIDIITDYCRENNIPQTPIQLPVQEEKLKIDTKKASFTLYKAGKTIPEIALERGFTTSTIEGHLSHFISSGEIDLYTLVPKDKADRIINFITEKKPASLNETKVAMGDDVSYGELRAVMKYLDFINT